jgi:hypothetical protein
MGSGLVGLQRKVPSIVHDLFTLWRKWIILGGTTPSGPARPQVSKHWNSESKDRGNTYV